MTSIHSVTPIPVVGRSGGCAIESEVDRFQLPASPAPASTSGKRLEVPGYHHRRGVHCASMALRNQVFYHTGEKWSEALCFGLAAGLNFTYLREPGAPFFLIMGRGSDMEEHFSDALGIHLQTFRSDDDELAWDHLRHQLSLGRLVVLEADMFHLPYMVQSLELMDGVHFGGHKLMVTAFDPATDTVQVHDYAWPEPWTLSVEQLKAARGSGECPEPPRNGCFVFHFPDRLTPLKEAIPHALRTFVQQMRFPFLQFNGLAAIDRFCRQVTRWGRVMPAQERDLNVQLAAFMFERAGTGGGNFRNLYYRFLKEAVDHLEAADLAPIAGHYRRLAKAWREVTALLDEAAANPAMGMFADGEGPSRLMNEVKTLERRAVDELDSFLRRRGC